MDLDVKGMAVADLFGKNDNKENMYKVPPYQREYSWGKEQWDNFFVDIVENEKGYFIGSMITIKGEEDNKNLFEVIDGQQRTTTLSILLLAIYDTIKQLHKNNPEKKLLDTEENEYYSDLFRELKNMLIKNKKLKLTLSIQNNNYQDYEYLIFKMTEKNYQENEPKYFKSRKIYKAFNFFKEQLDEMIKDKDFELQVEEIFDFLDKVKSIRIVRINVENSNDAFMLFESINDRGKPLTPLDLIKNKLISQHSDDAEKTNDRWQKIIENIQEYKYQVRFLRHFYNAFYEKYKIDKIPIATQSKLIKIYEENIKSNPEKMLSELISKSEIYKRFVSEEKDEVFGDRFKTLKYLGIAPSYALLLYLFAKKYDEKKLNQVLNILEKWFIRRNITGYPQTGGLDRMFFEIIRKIENNENDDYVDIILKHLTQPKYYKSDDEFAKILENSDLYEDNRKVLFYLFTFLENLKRTRETKTDFFEKNKNTVWSIEHILPQNPNKKSKWIELFGDEIDTYKSKLGNLTLTAYNSKLSNKDFEDKKHIKKNGNDIGLHSGNVKLNDFILECEEWTKECIDKRTQLLKDEIIKSLKLI